MNITTYVIMKEILRDPDDLLNVKTSEKRTFRG